MQALRFSLILNALMCSMFTVHVLLYEFYIINILNNNDHFVIKVFNAKIKKKYQEDFSFVPLKGSNLCV